MARSEDWFTPKHVFDALGVRFDLDVAAPIEGPKHVPCTAFISEQGDGLKVDWKTPFKSKMPFVWMNPPFGHQTSKRAWLQKFVDNGNGIALMPDRTSAPWFQEFAPQMDRLLFVSPKLKFERPDGTVGEQPGQGTCLMARGVKGAMALRTAKAAGLGVVL